MKIEEFWSHVDQSSGENSCWVWTLSCTTKGYGQVKLPDTSERQAHRIAYRLEHPDTFDPSLCVLHRCDNPPCCNPNHLFQGTHADNARDREQKNRGDNRQGSNHPMSVLTEEDVVDLLMDYASKDWSQRDLAYIYKLSHQQVSQIVRGTRWNHVYTKFHQDRALKKN